MKKVKISLLGPDDEPILAGRLTGRRTLLRVLEQLPAVVDPTVVILDFSGADYVTSSYLSEALFPLRDHLRLRRPPSYVVLANLSENVREEVDEFLWRSGEAVFTCVTGPTGQISGVELAGTLEEKLQETLDLIIRRQEATASELYTESRESQSIGPTAWNNRLSALAAKSLLVEIPQGRAKKYRPVLEVA